MSKACSGCEYYEGCSSTFRSEPCSKYKRYWLYSKWQYVEGLSWMYGYSKEKSENYYTLLNETNELYKINDSARRYCKSGWRMNSNMGVSTNCFPFNLTYPKVKELFNKIKYWFNSFK